MSFHHYTSLSIALAATLASQAQPGTLDPDRSGHDEPIQLENLVVTAAPGERDQSSLAVPTSVLLGQALATRMQPSLGETLAGQPGVSSSYFGPGSSRPIIRGLGGDRVQVLENGTGSIDVSVTSPDHAVSLDPLLVERIEVVRGPAALMYGGSAVGGVVNVIDHRIHSAPPTRTVELKSSARISSVDNGRAGTVIVDGGKGAFAWHADAYRRVADDVQIPGYSNSATVRAASDEHASEHGEPVPTHAKGSIPNTALTADGAAAGVSYLWKRGFIGFAASGHNARYGIPSGGHVHDDEASGDATDAEPVELEEPPVRVDLKQRRLDVRGELKLPESFVEGANFKLGLADYRHQELEGSEIGTVFRSRGYDSRIELLHKPVGFFSGAVGTQISHIDLDAQGSEAFLPPSHTATHALFLFEEAVFGPVAWQLGGRLEAQRIRLEDGSRESESDSSVSLSSGFVWTLNKAWSVSTSLARTERAPNVQELFSNGQHAGTQAYEIGARSLRREESVALDLSIRRRTGLVTGEITVFANAFDNYVFQDATGEERDGMPVYRYAQADTLFMGAEMELRIHLHKTRRHGLDLSVTADYVRAEARRAEQPLPRITPARVTVGLDYRAPNLSAGLSMQVVDRARRLAPGELPTAGYTLLGATVTHPFTLGRVSGEAFMVATNLMDKEARNHASFLKQIAPLPGRDIAVGLRMKL